MAPDTFTWDTTLEDWLFMVALGIALGLVIAGTHRWRRGELRPGQLLILVGALLGIGCGLAVVDVSPVHFVVFRVKPLASTAVEGLALVGGLLAGAAAVFGASLLAFRTNLRRPSAAAGLVVLAGVVSIGGLLWAIDEHTSTPLERRHPAGTVRPETVAAMRVIEGLSIPTGIDIAANGDLATVDLSPPTVRIFRPEGARFAKVREVALAIGERQAFHIRFHPDYPEQPFAYVSAEGDSAAGRVLQVIRIDLSPSGPQETTVIDNLPVGPREVPGDHYGSGLAFCGEYFYVGTSDTEPQTLHGLDLHDPRVRRPEAQSLASAAGKILRYRLDGTEMAPDGMANAAVPIYALGFRNPFGIGCDAATGKPLVADNGPGKGYDQLRLVSPGENAEWPLSDQRETLRKPVFTTGITGTAPTGVTSRQTANGTEAVVTTFASQALYAITYNSDGRATGKLRLLREVDGGAYAVASDANGCVYFTDVESVWRLDDGHCAR